MKFPQQLIPEPAQAPRGARRAQNGTATAPAATATAGGDHAQGGRPADLVGWVDERTGGSGFLTGMLYRKVPKGTNWFYTLGSATLFAFSIQAITGVFLAMYYTPSPTEAYASITHLTNDVFLGEFVRGMHKWGASVMVILVFLHMGRTFFFGAYKYPRELNWVIGVVLLILTLVMGFTGYLLPFDQRSFWATVVGVNINGTGALPRALPERLPARRARVRRRHAFALLRDPHAARPGADHRADRRTSLPRRQARHHGAAVAGGGDEAEVAARGEGGMNRAEKEQYLREYEVAEEEGQALLPLRRAQGLGDGADRRARSSRS